MAEYIVHDEEVRYGPNLVTNIRVASGEDLVRCKNCVWKTDKGYFFCRKHGFYFEDLESFCSWGEEVE